MSGCVAARLSIVLPGFVHEDQIGLPGIFDGIRIAIDVVGYCQRNGVAGALVCLD